ncbi:MULTISPECIES: ABC-2 transporter permease [unclassified Paenibacillus]|uniref:ABC-2 transporter permease n=1 Tax=unclassified Paenibacillus TaxID=185978 RepID=UPI001C104DF4|nr:MULTISPECIES: ABC-2 transporter permease [unclassified Paenibacillus]MBU5444848.1 ABC-2 transporter permease [Paenibacillus sp. MSJ-34]CAH0121916.1 hypothetical protein PAE9249_04451 [Paenibacillus sp. CECT 9249]
MLFHLVKKDFLLTKKYWIVMLIAAVVLPLFLHSRIDFIAGGFLPFFLSTLYIVYLLFSTVLMMEYKYRGSALLCATPYTRKYIVRAKYLFVLTVFTGCYVLYTLTALIPPLGIDLLDLSAFGWAFFINAVIFGVLIPVQYRFDYEKLKYIFFFLIFLMPFVLPAVMKVLQHEGTGFRFSLPFTPFVQDLFLIVLGLVIGGISMRVSVRIYSKKNL